MRRSVQQAYRRSHQHLGASSSSSNFSPPRPRCEMTSQRVMSHRAASAAGDGGDACRNAHEPRFHRPVLIARRPTARAAPAVAINIPEIGVALSTRGTRTADRQNCGLRSATIYRVQKSLLLFIIYLFAKTMLYSIKFRQNINMHGLLETAGYLNTSYADP